MFWSTFFSLFCIFGIQKPVNADGFYNIAHMTNNIPSIDWAMQQGANSIEIDLQFKADGTPYKFFHSSTCDCSCMCPAGGCQIAYPNSVCMQLEKTSTYPCDANTDAVQLLRHAANQRNMAMIIIDSKLTDGKQMSVGTLKMAARKVINLVDENLFGRGFNGSLIIGATGFVNYEFVKEIANSKSINRHRIHFTIDMEDMKETKERLDFQWNKNLVYNVGISACAPVNKAHFSISKLAALNTARGTFGMTYTWSVDLYKSLKYYTNYFNGIITNYPGALAGILKEQGIRLAKPSDVILQATSSEVITDDTSYKCECTYHKGGCQVTKEAPTNTACQCTYPFLWTCEGWVVRCTNPGSPLCKSPGLTKKHCEQGRGDCGGY